MIETEFELELNLDNGRDVCVILSLFGEVNNDSFTHAFGTERLPNYVTLSHWSVLSAKYADNGVETLIDGEMMDLIRTEAIRQADSMADAITEQMDGERDEARWEESQEAEFA